jgi:hypothetical protein
MARPMTPEHGANAGLSSPMTPDDQSGAGRFSRYGIATVTSIGRDRRFPNVVKPHKPAPPLPARCLSAAAAEKPAQILAPHRPIYRIVNSARSHRFRSVQKPSKPARSHRYGDIPVTGKPAASLSDAAAGTALPQQNPAIWPTFRKREKPQKPYLPDPGGKQTASFRQNRRKPYSPIPGSKQTASFPRIGKELARAA